MIGKGLSICFLFLLVACAQTVVRPVRVESPLPVVYPVDEVQAPPWPMEGLPDKASAFETLRALMVENELRKTYEIRLKAAFEACRK